MPAKTKAPKKLLAYHGDSKIKAKYLARVRDHRAADQLVQGSGWDGSKGCSVGCTFEKYDHDRGPIEIGVQWELMLVNDDIFEGLPKDEAMLWPEQFLDAIEPGADLSLVWPKFSIWLMLDSKWGMIALAEEDDTKTLIRASASIFEEWVRSGEKPPHDCPQDVAYRAAWDAWAAGAAGAARDAWAAGAARDAWAAWAAGAARDAWAAGAAGAARDARAAGAAKKHQAARAQRDYLLVLLKEVKP